MSMQAQTTRLDEALRRTRRAGPGATVEVVDRAGRRTLYELVAEPIDPAPRRVALGSPEGLALFGARPGDAVTLPTANGRRRRVSVVGVTRPARARDLRAA